MTILLFADHSGHFFITQAANRLLELNQLPQVVWLKRVFNTPPKSDALHT